MNSREPDPENWLEIRVKLPAEYAEPVTHLFTTYGDGRVFVSQSGEWDADDVGGDANPNDDVTVFCYLKNDDTVENRKGMIGIGLRLMSELTDMEPHHERIVTADEWANQSFPTIRVADRITISPWSLEDGVPTAPENDDVQVYLSPGLAFGTGNHPTTRLCLKGVIEDADANRMAGARVLDVGCGSGVLTIVTLKSGASEAWCLDIDETAIRAVRDNLVMSGVSERAHVLCGSVPHAELPDIKFDYVLANITSRVLIDLANAIVDQANPGGTILASGILAEQSDAVRDAFINTRRIEISETRQDGDWVMLRIVKSNDETKS